MTIAVDGVDHAGKSSLARFLSWQLQMPVIETDFTLVRSSSPPTHDAGLLRKLVEDRHHLNDHPWWKDVAWSYGN